MLTHYDVAIAGAGPAGAASARRLALAGCRVVLIERSRFDRPRAGESLAPNVQPLLADLGVWQQFLDLKPLPSYGTRSAWGSSIAAEHSHLQTPYLSGWYVDRLDFDGLLVSSAVGAGAQLLLGTQVLRCVPESNGSFVLSITSDETSVRVDELRVDFIIDATGRGSTIARRLGAKPIMLDRLVGVAAQFTNKRAETSCYTLVETTPEGWWYSAPVATNTSMTVLMTDGDLVSSQGTRNLPQWRNALSRAELTGAYIDGCEMKWGLRTFSAVSQRLRRSDKNSERWLAVGDAALAVDPLSGSGVIRALQTAGHAVSTVLASLAGDKTAIDRYEANRDNECTDYLLKRVAYYQMERRWPTAPFWQRRIETFERAAATSLS